MTNVKTWMLRLAAVAASASVFAFAGCSGDDGAAGKQGPPGTTPEGGTVQPCSVSEGTDGCATITCPGSSPVKVCGKSGADGGIGTCTITDNPDAGVGCKTISCSDGTTQDVCNGTSPDGGPVTPGAGLKVEIGVSAPGNGQYFVAGEQITLTFTLTAADGTPLTKDLLKRANLYMAGPRDVLKTKTAVKLLRANTDRAVQPHHYIDLLTSTDANLTFSGNVATYKLDPITDEAAGTYKVGLWTELKANALDQVFALQEVQIGTATAETGIVGNCGDCHKGAANNVMYLHHVDPGYSPLGNPSLDSVPVDTCINCHNQEGYAAIRKCADNSKPTGSGTTYTCADGTQNWTWLPDPIVRRVHGVHNGANLLAPFSLVDFENYEGLHFPADIKNCAKCHTSDAWKTKPSRQACGACHDQVDFTTGNFVPNRPTTVYCRTIANCSSLPSTAAPTCDMSNPTNRCADLTAPSSSGTCADGSTPSPAGICALTKHGGGAQADDTGCGACHGAGSMADTAVAHKIALPNFKYTVDISLSAPANGTDYEGSEAPVVTVTVKDASTGAVVDPATFTQANKDAAELFVSGPRMDTKPVLTTAAANPGSTSYYVFNDLTVQTSSTTEDPKVTRSATSYSYQLNAVTGLEPGTYTVLFIVAKSGVRPMSWAVKNFNVGQATDEPPVATNCTSCHEDTRMHGGYFAVQFKPDICKSCHDYQAQNANKTAGWGSSNANYGFGAAPLKRRVHGVHFGHYLNHPEQIHSASDASEWADIIFPQDVRNCTKCHDATATAGTWAEEPGRLACLACHDSDNTLAHATLMTIDPTPASPYSGDETESCPTCHGDGKDYAVKLMHNITNPYQPPYPR